MQLARRRAVLASGLALLSGCASGDSDRTGAETTLAETARETEKTRERTPTRTPESDVHEPDVSLQFGEAYVDTDLGIAVEAPAVTTSFEYDGKTYEMPEGDALAFASVEFSNTHADESRPIDGPIFTLVDGETAVLETHSVAHPSGSSVRIRNVNDTPTTGRWDSHGSGVEPGERRAGTAAFEVADDADPSALKIVYESDRIRDDRFGGAVVEWSG